VVVGDGLVAHQPTLDHAVAGDLKADALVVGAAGCREPIPLVALGFGLLAVHHPAAPVAVQPLEVEWVEGVLLALEPVARQLDGVGEATALPDEDVPARQQRRGLRAHVREDQAAEFLNFVRLDVHFFLEARACGLRGLIHASAGFVEQPAMVGAADALGFGYAVGQVGLAVGAGGFDQAKDALRAPEEHEVLAQQANLFGGGLLVELGAAGDGVPVAAHELAHWRAGTHSRDAVVHGLREHGL